MGDPVIMLSLYPEFPKAVMSSLASCGEFLFLVDRSGSMDCAMHGRDTRGKGPDRIGSARVLHTCLLLAQGLKFSVLGTDFSPEDFIGVILT